MRPLILLAAAVVSLFHCASASAAPRPPNVIFIIADDLGYGDLGCYGQRRIQTPHLDRMAAEGMRFTQHYSGNAVCAQSRCVLMTGKHPGHAFIRDNRSIQPEGRFFLSDFDRQAALARLQSIVANARFIQRLCLVR